MTTLVKKGRTLPTSYFVLGTVAALGLAMGILRFVAGLGPTTNLSDSYPWGLWIVYDVFFVPFSAGAFMISAITHIYNKEEYHPIARPVVLAGFVGYLFVVLVLLMDLGRWHKFYNILIPWYWNLHSFMFEVSLCITLYTGVLVMEVAPAIMERFNWRKPLRVIKIATVVIAGAGIVLSSLHQSSLGSLFLLMPYKLHPLWWTPLLPLLFFTSAAFSGLSMAIFVAVLSFKAFRRRLKLGLLTDLAKIVSVMLGIYLVLKVGDLVFSGEIGLIFSQGWLSLLFVAEMVAGVIVPMILFGTRRVRERASGLVQGATCVLVGLAVNRAGVAWLALKAPAGAAYLPHWMELVIAVAAIAAGVLIFVLAARFLPVFHGSDHEGTKAG
jgi:Ni/Fe-hydrogenase subunit HybB-like protein